MTYQKDSTKRVTCRLVIVIAALLLLFTTASGQFSQSWSPTDNGKNAAFVLSGVSGTDEVNLYNGRVSLKVPLGTIGARGRASYQPTVSISRTFVLRKVQDWLNGGWGTSTLQLISENYQDSYDYSNFQPGLLPAVLFGRKTRDQNPGFGGTAPPCGALTKIYMRTPGGQIELRDLWTGGEPNSDQSLAPLNRRRDWHTVDGSAIYFRSDTDIIDETCGDRDWPAMNGGNVFYPTGYLVTKDGTQYRFVQGMPKWVRDRNGNTITFGQLGAVTDSIGRQYQVSSSGFTYPGIDGGSRTVSIIEAPLASALRADFQAGGVKTEQQLFPAIAFRLRGAANPFNPNVITVLRLPNNLEYHFFYNEFGEIARVEMPAGGVVEYDYAGNVNNSENPQIYRYVTTKRVYVASGQLESRVTFDFVPGTNTLATVKTFDAANNVVRHERHTFKGSVGADFTSTAWYQPFDNGREIIVETLNETGLSVLRRTDNTWRTLDWSGNPTTPPTNASTHQTQLDCALTEVKLTLSDSNQISRTTFNYDGFTNQTDIYEYELGSAGSGVAGPLVRRTHIDFLNDVAYTQNTGPHIWGLISQRWISSDAAGTNKLSLVVNEYDNYALVTRHAPLVDRANIAGLCIKLDDSAATCLQASDTGYVTRGNLTERTSYSDVAGNISSKSSTQFDIAGNAVKTINERGYSTTIGYADCFGGPDGDAHVHTAPAPLAGKSAFAFATSTTNARGQTFFNQYNYYSGVAVDQEDPNGVVSTFIYGLGGTGAGGVDLLDRPSKAIRAANNATAKTQTSYLYDDAQRMIRTTSDLTLYDDNVLKRETFYDGLGRTFETRSYETPTEFITIKTEYDSLGRVKRAYNPYRTTTDDTYGWTDTLHDVSGRPTSTQTFDRFGTSTGLSTTAYYGAMALKTDQAGKKRITDIGVLGIMNVWEIAAPDAATTTVSFNGQSFNAYRTQYQYDATGSLTKVIQGGQQRDFEYDDLGRLTDTTNPESGHTSYHYDAAGNLDFKTDANNVTTTFAYDEINRTTTQSYNDGTPTVTYSYDTSTLGVGRLASVSSSVSTFAYTEYDALGRVKASTQTVDAVPYNITYAYNRAGSLTSQIYPSGRTVATEYDGAGRIAGVKNGTTGQFYAGATATDATNRFQYSTNGAVRALKLGNTLWEHTDFNSRLQAVQVGLGTSISDSSKLRLDYTYGVLVGSTLDTAQNNGNIQSQTIVVPGTTFVQTYTYDDLNRLKSATEAANSVQSWTQNYSYDRFGNRTFAAGTTLPAISPPNDVINNPSISQANNRISTAGYEYDAAGNLKCDPEHPCVSGVAYYVYNAENRVRSVNGGSGAGGASYFYDGNGRRVKKVLGGASPSTTIFVYDDDGTLIAEYSDAAQPPSSGGTNYITIDNLGTPRVITDQNAGVKGRHDYLPFGEEIAGTVGNRSTTAGYPPADTLRQKFTGKERDETGLDFFNARYYVAKFGRFMSPDYIEGNPGTFLTSPDVSSALPYASLLNPQTINLYAYVGNNPLSYADPTGHQRKYYDVKDSAGKKTGYKMAVDAGGQYDSPNIHVFDRKGREVGRFSLKPDDVGFGKGERVPVKVQEAVRAYAVERWGADAVARGVPGTAYAESFAARQAAAQAEAEAAANSSKGGPRSGGTGGTISRVTTALLILHLGFETYFQFRDARELGYYYDFFGRLIITDLELASRNLPRGTRVEYKGIIFVFTGTSWINPTCGAKLVPGKDGRPPDIVGGC